MSLIGIVLVSVALNALAQIGLRAGMKAAGFEPSLKWLGQLLVSWPFLSGLACYAVSIVVWLYVLSRLQVSLAYPFQAAGYILGAVLAWILLGEAIRPLNMLGLALIFLGLVCLSLEVARSGWRLCRLRRGRIRRPSPDSPTASGRDAGDGRGSQGPGGTVSRQCFCSG